MTLVHATRPAIACCRGRVRSGDLCGLGVGCESCADRPAIGVHPVCVSAMRWSVRSITAPRRRHDLARRRSDHSSQRPPQPPSRRGPAPRPIRPRADHAVRGQPWPLRRGVSSSLSVAPTGHWAGPSGSMPSPPSAVNRLSNVAPSPWWCCGPRSPSSSSASRLPPGSHDRPGRRRDSRMPGRRPASSSPSSQLPCQRPIGRDAAARAGVIIGVVLAAIQALPVLTS